MVAIARGARIVHDRTVPKDEAMANSSDMVFAIVFLLSDSEAHLFSALIFNVCKLAIYYAFSISLITQENQETSNRVF